ncbi:hypothetical protein O0L34_g1616 [Tuta absoluta]|nr:hypothetical protein O0L34_g1616 [Tuta absoluta]
MDFSIQTPDENIKDIEDIINIQKANGNFNVRQVAFNLPEEGGGGGGGGLSAGLARSHESGLTRVPRVRARCKGKKRQGKGHKVALPDNVSWPSDSDITVLRMKNCGRGALSATATDVLAGDGLHRADDDSSMVNLATLVLPAQSTSKHSLAQEQLLPLSSWERHPSPGSPPAPAAPCPASSSECTAKSRLARFLRLYFCPCCTCLYEMEKNMRDEHSFYRDSTCRSLGTGSD